MKNYILSFLLFLGFVNLSFSQTVTIGSQVWMTKNLDVVTFRNGDTIPQAKTLEELNAAQYEGKPMWYYYDFDPYFGEMYGKLYNYYAIMDKRGLAPLGWKVPTKKDWQKLIGTGSDSFQKLYSTLGWVDGFPELIGSWWSSSIDKEALMQAGIDASCRIYISNDKTLEFSSAAWETFAAVRCIKENP